MKVKFYILTIFNFLLVGCGPSYKTNFILPDSQEGRYCVNQCLAESYNCSYRCKNQLSECNNIEDIKSYALQLIKQSNTDKSVNSVSNFTPPKRNCYADNVNCKEDCNQYYEQCYTNCGGKVTYTKID